MTHEQHSELMELATKAFHYNYDLGRASALNADLSVYSQSDPEFDFINFLYNAFEIEEEKKNDERSKR